MRGVVSMKTKEKIAVFTKIVNGKTICICHAGHKGCGDPFCSRDVVTRDKFAQWEQTMRRDKYGR